VVDFFILRQLVDRILQEQKARRQVTKKVELHDTKTAEREEAEKVRAATSTLFISNLLEMTLHYTQTKKIPIAQTNIPLPPADTVIASLSPLAIHGTAGVEKALKRSHLTLAVHELVNFLYQDSPDAASSRSPSPSTSTSPSLPGAFMLEQPRLSRELVRSPQPDPTVTSLSSIGMSLETNISGKISGCHLMLHFI
jgi:hypothetical protein